MTLIQPDVEAARQIGARSAFGTLKTIAKGYPGRLVITLGLVVAENALLLAYPLFAGFSINAILRGDARAAVLYAGAVLAFWLVSAARRAIDTRTFTRIYADLAVGVIVDQRTQHQPVSTVAARVVLAREFVNFFELHIPLIMTALVSIIGAAVMLLAIEPQVGLACLGTLALCAVWVPRYARRNEELHERLNNRLEREVALVGKVGTGTLLRHYIAMSRLRIWLSDREATAFVVIGAIAAALFAFTIVRLSGADAVQAGHVYSVMTYLWTFVTSLDEAPGMVDQLARLRDIGKRVGKSD